MDTIATREYPFTSVLIGNGHTISDLALEGTTFAFSYEFGLFGVIENGIVRNLVLRNPWASINNASYGNAGFIAGTLINGLIEHCAVLGGNLTADIGLDSLVGGLVGFNQGTLQSCVNTSDVTIYTGSSKNRISGGCGAVCVLAGMGYLRRMGRYVCGSGGTRSGAVEAFCGRQMENAEDIKHR